MSQSPVESPGPVLTPATREIVAMVREAKARPFVCQGCGAEAAMAVTAGAMSRLPVKCEACQPSSPTWRRERAERPLRAAVLELHQRVQELEALIAAGIGGDGSLARARRFGEPGRPALRRAITRVAHATGARGTADALLDVAVVAHTWAATLHHTYPDQEGASP